MTRPLTPVVAPYVIPIADQFATRARAYAIVGLLLDGGMALAMYKLIMLVRENSTRGTPWTAVAVCAAIVALVAAIAIWRLQTASRAMRVARRAVDDTLRFAFDTKRVGEVGPDGQIMAEMSFPITAEQFAHLLSMPRPQLAFQAPLPQATVRK